MASCPLCRERKGKRACPARGEAICAHCCGTKRLTEIACPQDCVYLTGAHAPAWEGRDTERRRDARRVLLHAQRLPEKQQRLYFLALVGLNGIRASRRDLDDRLLAQAVTALHKTVETRRKGVIYEHQAEDARAQGLMHDVQGIFASKDEAGRSLAPDDRDLEPVLAALEATLAETAREQAGATAFLDSAARVVGRVQPPSAGPSRPLIVEP